METAKMEVGGASRGLGPALQGYEELVGFSFAWVGLDGLRHKAPLGGEKTGPNPTDRGKMRHKQLGAASSVAS